MVTYTSGVNSSLRNSGVYTTGINVVNQQSPDATIQPVRPELSQSSISGKASTQTINGIYRSGASTSGTYTSGTGSAGTYRSGASTSSTYTSGTGSAGTYRSGASTSGTYTSGTSSAGTYRSGVSTSGTYTSRTSSAGLSSTFSSFAHAGATLSQNIDRIVSSNVPTTESVPLSSQPNIGFSQNNGLVPNPNYNSSSSNLGVSSGTGLTSNGTVTSSGTVNGEFKPLDIFITDEQSYYKTDHQGSISHYNSENTADPKVQEYLYRLSQKTGMDYPLLAGIWCSESGAQTYQLSPDSNSTFGLDFSYAGVPESLNIIERGYVQDSGSGVIYENNYGSQMRGVIREAYMETYGTEPPEDIFKCGNAYYDAAIACVNLNVQSYNPTAGGSFNVDSMYDAFNNYTGGYERAIQYANSIRENLGWPQVDYVNSMKNSNMSENFTRELNWVNENN